MDMMMPRSDDHDDDDDDEDEQAPDWIHAAPVHSVPHVLRSMPQVNIWCELPWLAFPLWFMLVHSCATFFTSFFILIFYFFHIYYFHRTVNTIHVAGYWWGGVSRVLKRRDMWYHVAVCVLMWSHHPPWWCWLVPITSFSCSCHKWWVK